MVLTLEEVLETCRDWEQFCDDFGWDYYAVAEGGGHIDVSLTVSQARYYGIVRDE